MSKWHLHVLGSFQTAHTQKSSCQKEMLSLFTTHREPQGPVTSMKSHCSSPRSKTTASENGATLPKLRPQLQMLQAGCTDIPAQRALSPFLMPSVLPSWFCYSSLPSNSPALGDALTQGGGKHFSFCWPPPPLSQLSLSHTCDTLFPLQILLLLVTQRTQDRQQMLAGSYTCILSPNHWCSNPVKKMLFLIYDSFSLFSFQICQLLKLSVASEQHQEAMEHSMDILYSKAII